MRALAPRRSFVAVLAVVGCSAVDGTPVDVAAVAGAPCAVDLDCGAGRHCGNDGHGPICTIACAVARDCGPGSTCSPCGRCVAPGALDDACLPVTDRPCDDDASCRASLGEGWRCEGTCARTCDDDAVCGELGRGFRCDDGLCVRGCVDDPSCFLHGFGFRCALPDGVDPVANADAAEPVLGTCVSAPERIDYPAPQPTDPPSARLVGTWGFLLTSAVRTQGIPLLTKVDTVSIQHLLVQVLRDGDGVTLTEKWCGNELRNFAEDDGPLLDLFQVVEPDRAVDAIRLVQNRIDLVPPIADGAAFVTHEQLDLRGAKLTNPATDPLPSYKALEGAWDQDRDGHPGMTAKVTGALAGELYQAQRWRPTLHGTIVDADHLHGLAKGPSDQSVLGASTERLINDSWTTEHPHEDRSYFRAQRLKNEASCADVLRLARTEGAWLWFEPHFDPASRPAR